MKTIPGRQLRMLVVSDIHLGHRRTPTAHILKSMRLMIPMDKRLLQYDTIEIVGDLFDRGLNWTQPEVIEIENYMIELLMACKEYDVQLNVLEGTPSHDVGQVAKIVHLNKVTGINADLNYFADLCVHYNEKFDYWSLYVPDEYHATCDETYAKILELMSEARVEKVDFGFFHGFFEHQVPGHINHHKSSNYRPLVRQVIYCGHNHLTSNLDDFVFVQGSLDRLAFGEMGKKGMFDATFDLDKHYPDANFKIKFMVNDNAMVFDTVEIVGLDVDEALTHIDKMVEGKPNGSWFSILTDNWKDHSSLYEAVKKKYRQFNFDKGRVKKEKTITLDSLIPRNEIRPINENTLSNMIVERLREEGVNPDTINRVVEKLQSRMAEVS